MTDWLDVLNPREWATVTWIAIALFAGIRFAGFGGGMIRIVKALLQPKLIAVFGTAAAYTRQMMGFLLFNPSPQAIEIIGLGGGSLAKYCYRHLPDTAITAVEIDPKVIAVGDQFFMPPEGIASRSSVTMELHS